MRLHPLAGLALVVAAIPAPAQIPAEEQALHEQRRRQRQEMMEQTYQAQRKAWQAFEAEAAKDGVYLECTLSQPAPGQVVLYREFAFRLRGNGELQNWGKYRIADGVATWGDDQGVLWTLQLDGWGLKGVVPPSRQVASDQCRRLRGDAKEIKAAAPDFARIR